MKWEKKGIIYTPFFDDSWKNNSALTPTAFLLNEQVIRIYASFRDKHGVGRIGYIDIDAKNPSRIIKISDKPVLDIGRNGTFDDNGVILGDVVRVNEEVYMYYVGFQLVNKVKFLAYTGLAISRDNGENFVRYKQTPIFDRDEEALYIRAIHSVRYENDKFKVWYATGNGWETINDTEYPRYDISYIESDDGIHFHGKGIKCIENDKANFEYRIGRPRVYKKGNVYVMNFTYGTTDGRYIAGQAISHDGISWDRNDDELGITLSKKGWDSIHLIYPSVISIRETTYMFYNGNNMGRDGFGYAVLDEE